MSSGERPIGAAKGKQSDTEALCQPPPLQSPSPPRETVTSMFFWSTSIALVCVALLLYT